MNALTTAEAASIESVRQRYFRPGAGASVLVIEIEDEESEDIPGLYRAALASHPAATQRRHRRGRRSHGV
jgi:hypothetical protein